MHSWDTCFVHYGSWKRRVSLENAAYLLQTWCNNNNQSFPTTSSVSEKLKYNIEKHEQSLAFFSNSQSSVKTFSLLLYGFMQWIHAVFELQVSLKVWKYVIQQNFQYEIFPYRLSHFRDHSPISKIPLHSFIAHLHASLLEKQSFSVAYVSQVGANTRISNMRRRSLQLIMLVQHHHHYLDLVRAAAAVASISFRSPPNILCCWSLSTCKSTSQNRRHQ